jgi:hypothetical protein
MTEVTRTAPPARMAVRVLIAVAFIGGMCLLALV